MTPAVDLLGTGVNTGAKKAVAGGMGQFLNIKAPTTAATGGALLGGWGVILTGAVIVALGVGIYGYLQRQKQTNAENPATELLDGPEETGLQEVPA
ncbi:MAG: hypothetical protein H7832_05250 [Magnetococcus sp. DMHC-6]